MCGKPYVAATNHAKCMPTPGCFVSLLEFRLKAPTDTPTMVLLAEEFDRTVKKRATQADIIAWTARAKQMLRMVCFRAQCDPDVYKLTHREVCDAQATRSMFLHAIRVYGDTACAELGVEPMAVC